MRNWIGRLAEFAFGLTKHGLASFVVVAGFTLACTILCTVAYCALLLVAIIGNKGLGSPLMPILVPVGSFVASFVASAICTLAFLAPSTAFAEWACGSGVPRRVALQIPTACAAMFVELLTVCAIFAAVAPTGSNSTGCLAGAALLFAILAVPLGVYWWTLKSADGVRAAIRAFMRAVAGSHR